MNTFYWVNFEEGLFSGIAPVTVNKTQGALENVWRLKGNVYCAFNDIDTRFIGKWGYPINQQ